MTRSTDVALPLDGVVATGVADLVPIALNTTAVPNIETAGIARMERACDVAGDSPGPAPNSHFEDLPVCLARSK